MSEAVRDGVGDEASDGMSDKVSYEVSEAVRDGVGDEASDEVSDKVSDTGNDEGEGDSIACWSTDKSERGSPDGRCFREKKLLSSSLCFLSSSIHIHSLHCVSFGSSLDGSSSLTTFPYRPFQQRVLPRDRKCLTSPPKRRLGSIESRCLRTVLKWSLWTER